MAETQKEFYPDFLIIPYQIYSHPKLKKLDHTVYAVIYWYAKLKDGKCTASNSAIARIAKSSFSGVTSSLIRLEKYQTIKRVFSQDNKRTEIVPLITYGGYSIQVEGVTPQSKGGYSVERQISNIDKELVLSADNTAVSTETATIPIKELVKYYSDLVERVRGFPIKAVKWGQVGKLLKERMRYYKLDDIKQCLEYFVKSDDCIRLNCDLGTALSAYSFNKWEMQRNGHSKIKPKNHIFA